MDLTDLQGKDWIIQSVNAADTPGVDQSDLLRFAAGTSATSDATITHVSKNLSTGATNQSSWATSCRFTPEGLTGVTDLGRSFLITSSPLASDPTKQQLTCQFVDTSTQQRKVKAAGTSAVLGAMIGAVAGYAAGLPFVGALIGFATALTGSVVTAASTTSFGQRYTSSGTWVADDGTAGRPAIVGPRSLEIAPRCVKAASA